ncbi:DUF2637 domain-containing protein [Rhizocola hellebori]
MTVSAVSAAISSFAGLRELAVVAGWPKPLSFMFPLTIDAFALTATRVWLIKATGSSKARRFARTNAILAILMSLAGNACWHLIAAGLLRTSWLVVVAVGAVPALVLGLVSHLAVLRTQVDPPVSNEAESRTPSPPPEPKAVPSPPRQRAGRPRPVGGPDELLGLARQADTAWRAQHDGRPISRDGLRQALRIGGTRASALARALKLERQVGVHTG